MTSSYKSLVKKTFRVIITRDTGRQNESNYEIDYQERNINL